MSKRKFKFVDLADDDYIKEEIVNQKDIYNVKEVEIDKIAENLVKIDKPIQEEAKIELIKKIEEVIEPKFIVNEEIKIIPDSKPEIIKHKKDVMKSKDVIDKKNNANIFFKEKEKLDIKTNIYLKKDNYLKIEELYKSTGNSRSAIINKLIEIALNKINEN